MTLPVHATALDHAPDPFDGLDQRYGRMVHGIALSYVRPGDAQDLVQEVFLKALQMRHQLRDTVSMGAWLATITRNLARDYHRSASGRAQRRSEELREWSASQKPPPPEAFTVLDAIQSLPEAYRETVTLRFVEGLSGPEIAEQTGLTPESVRVNLCRGTKLLRERIAGMPQPATQQKGGKA